MSNRITLRQSKIGMFTDIHLGNYRDDSKWHTIAINLSRWIAEQYRQRGITDIIIPGDIFHNRFDVSVATLDCAKRFFDAFRDFNVIITTGNHDSYYRDRDDVNSLEVFDEWPNMTIVSRKVEIIDQFERKIALCPWATKIADIPTCDVVVGHFEIAGFLMSPGKVCAHGIESKRLVERGNLILSGHFHQAAERKYNGGIIKYLGTPYQLNWAEAGDDKFIYTLDLETMNMEAIRNDMSPKHIKIKLSEWASTRQLEHVTGNIINAIIDTQQAPAEQSSEDEAPIVDSIVQAFLSAIAKEAPVDCRTTYYTMLTSILSSDKEFDGVDVLSAMREFVDLLDVETNKKNAVLERLAELYAQHETFI